MRPNEKLSPWFYGPFQVEDTVAYLLCLPPNAKIHPVFHVSQLKKSLSPYVTVHLFPKMLTSEVEMQVIPEAVIKKRRMTDGSMEVLVKWQGLPESNNTWEVLENMKQQFPLFILEDKVLPDEGGNDGIGPSFTYIRRKRGGLAEK